ncbi:MAG: prolyl-tRNA editing enzyme YbaK/EbsC (Cys-tRNA(Pro) deacylase) [Polaromonas sp.]|jgi:prolyl-tRNA editing enzyme YbaK/EbsC (Cys-tRNA(Pro) deacylase)/predicted Fe-S protein YdhL (DUF1289 family)
MCGSELQALPDGVQRVAAFLQERGHAHLPVMLDGAARTAQQAADALGVELGQIAKSIVFRRKADDVAVMVVTSGDQRVDERKVEALVCPDGQRLGRADAAFVKAKTGFSIGGVSPVAHAAPLIILVDQSLFRFDEVWAAAGHPNAVFSLTAEALLRLSGAQVIDASIETPLRPAALSSLSKIGQRALAVSQSQAGGSIPSPCISVCQINTGTGMCTGCYRSLPEIADWSHANDDEKRRIWGLIAARASLA